MLEGFSTFGGHLQQIFFDHYNYLNLNTYHYVYGKTFAFLKGTLPAISTIDLDLLRRICIDESSIHRNRTILDTPLIELEEDCIGTAGRKQWPRLRKSVMRALK